MKPVHQTEFRQGLGDCLRACLATIFEIPISMMPNFWESTQDASVFWRETNTWLHENHGYRCMPISVNPGHEYLMEDLLCIASGKTVRGDEGHAVVWRNRMIHDPHPSGLGLLNDEPDVFIILVPTRFDG